MKFTKAYDQSKNSEIKTRDSLTEQHHAIECDINKIVAQHQQSGVPLEPIMGDDIMDYSDFDFQQAQDMLANANTLFEQVPAQIREEFDNDASKFLKFATNEKNKERMVEMGLIEKDSTIENSEHSSVSVGSSATHERSEEQRSGNAPAGDKSQKSDSKTPETQGGQG